MTFGTARDCFSPTTSAYECKKSFKKVIKQVKNDASVQNSVQMRKVQIKNL
jgi:hypothetical protein